MRTVPSVILVPDVVNRLTHVAWALWWHWQTTQLHGSDPWACALQLDTLIRSGLAEQDVGCLIGIGLVTTRRAKDTDEFNGQEREHNSSDLFAITEKGAVFLEQHCLSEIKPSWDHDRRILSIQGQVIKVFRQPSPNQETVLNAFQEDGWVDQVYDPLYTSTTCSARDAQSRLRKTVEHLNRAQHPPSICFSVAGNGEKACWSLRHASPSSRGRNGSCNGHNSRDTT
jgi:hypothetical protein